MDKTANKELLEFIMESISLVKRRFHDIESSDDFMTSDEGLDKLDAISMRLQAIGEAIKNIDKRDREFLLQVADRFYWSKIIKTREILTHHYIEIDSETIFDICENKIDELEEKINRLRSLL